MYYSAELIGFKLDFILQQTANQASLFQAGRVLTLKRKISFYQLSVSLQ